MTNDDFMPIERYYALKSTFERIWGKGTYLDLKHCSDLRVWKRYCERTLQATELAAAETVRIADDQWHQDLSEIIQNGTAGVKAAKSFDDLFQYFAATYAEISFHQIGFMPSIHLATRSQLRQGNWRLDRFRSVQYVQNADQRECLAKRLKDRKKRDDRDES
jgi:hypothetical protein